MTNTIAAATPTATPTAVIRRYDVALIRTTYFHRTKKIGSINTNQIGISYCGVKISRMDFDRFDMVRYYDFDGNCIGAFQDRCSLDD